MNLEQNLLSFREDSIMSMTSNQSRNYTGLNQRERVIKTAQCIRFKSVKPKQRVFAGAFYTLNNLYNKSPVYKNKISTKDTELSTVSKTELNSLERKNTMN